ncbi:ATP-binding protein [Vulcanisaeta sp. JCM 14467]|uniref:ATP-binding protein n=1 Tax=Vulcanisaeta sp. JCM 14467 TaxID=1295370 RepID=UPI000A490565|nr:DUF87 domain-containing protein [Vulcanisaeta sp. JCM 14467]
MYGKFLMLRHIKYFLNYKDFEITLRRIQQGEDVYSLYLASTTRFDSSFKWRWTPSIPISKILNAGYGRAWSMELNLIAFTPYSFQLISERRGIAVIGRDVNNREIYWSFNGSSPHVLIIGPTGAGKTTLAMSIAYQVKHRLKDRVKLVIIDPHGHTAMLNRLINNVRVVDLSKSRLMTREVSVLIESIRFSNPLLLIGTEGALLRMASINNGTISGIDELMRRLRELSNDLILREAYYNLYNVFAPIINYYGGSNDTSYDVYELLDGDTIFIMKSIISNELLRYLTMLILLSITKKAVSECRVPPCPLRYLVIIDEAHNVLKLPSEYKVLGFDDPLEKMFRELRKFGVALFALMQPPLDVLNEGVLGNIGTSIILSGNSQYVSHVMSSVGNIDDNDAAWLLSGRFRALVIRQGEPKPIKLSQLLIPKELLTEKYNG